MVDLKSRLWRPKPMKITRLALLAAVLLTAGLSTGCVRGQVRVVQGVSIKEDKPGLWQKATISPDAAMRTALTRVPGGRITEAELEEEDGRLIYSFDVRVDGRAGYDEVHVDARTGEVVKVEHEEK
jgi:peptidase YpeB-like protein